MNLKFRTGNDHHDNHDEKGDNQRNTGHKIIPPSYVRIRSPSGLSILCAAERNRWMPISSSPLSGKKQKQDSTVFSQKTGNQRKWLERLPPFANSFHRCGGPPPSKREVLGLRRSRPAALPSIAYRGFAVAPKPLRAPSRNLVYNPGSRVATLVVSMGVMGFLGDLREDRSRARPVGGSARRSIPSEREQPCCDL